MADQAVAESDQGAPTVWSDRVRYPVYPHATPDP
jgi:hypothetical protein